MIDEKKEFYYAIQSGMIEVIFNLDMLIFDYSPDSYKFKEEKGLITKLNFFLIN